MNNRFAFGVKTAAVGVLSVVFAGCATTGTLKPDEIKDAPGLLAQICRAGEDIKSVKGSVWMKASSADASGQFPAAVLATSPDKVSLEVTNLLGGTEATIKVEGSRYQIEIPQQGGKNARAKRGANSWGGIPLRWAPALFLGHTPCPSGVLPATALSANAAGDLVAQAGKETYRYHLTRWAGKPWVESLRWEAEGGVFVEFKFEDPEPSSGFARKWEAKSKQGEVKVRWKDREALR